MRKKWFLVERVSTRENSSNLNTKLPSRERREFLMKKIGLVSGNFNIEENNSGDRNNKVKAVVRAITPVLMANNLQGCGATSWTSFTMANSWRWSTTTWWILTTLMLIAVILYPMDKVRKVNFEMEKYKAVCKSIRETVNLRNRADPEEQILQDASRHPFSGVWLNHEDVEEETRISDAEVYDRQEIEESIERLNNTLDAFDEMDREATPRPRLRQIPNGVHGACEGDGSGDAEVEGEDGETMWNHRKCSDWSQYSVDRGRNHSSC